MTADRFKYLEFGDDEPAKGPPPNAYPHGAASDRGHDTGKDERWHLEAAARSFADGAYEPALRDYSAALKYRVDLEDAWVGQARCMVYLGQLEQA